MDNFFLGDSETSSSGSEFGFLGTEDDYDDLEDFLKASLDGLLGRNGARGREDDAMGAAACRGRPDPDYDVPRNQGSNYDVPRPWGTGRCEDGRPSDGEELNLTSPRSAYYLRRLVKMDPDSGFSLDRFLGDETCRPKKPVPRPRTKVPSRKPTASPIVVPADLSPNRDSTSEDSGETAAFSSPFHRSCPMDDEVESSLGFGFPYHHAPTLRLPEATGGAPLRSHPGGGGGYFKKPTATGKISRLTSVLGGLSEKSVKRRREMKAAGPPRETPASRLKKSISGSLMNILAAVAPEGGRDGSSSNEDDEEIVPPAGMFAACPADCHVLVVYIDGPMGVGKSTVVGAIAGSLKDSDILAFPEPYRFWTKTHGNVFRELNKCTGFGSAGKRGVSAKLLAAQLKIGAGLSALGGYLDQQTDFSASGTGPEGVLHRWCIFDIHPVSAYVVYPLCFLKRGHLGVNHFLLLLGLFRSVAGDVVVVLTGDPKSNLKRVKRRGRANESGVSLGMIEELHRAYAATAAARRLLDYVSTAEVVALCFGSLTLNDLVLSAAASEDGVTLTDIKKIFSDSLFAALRDVVADVKGDLVLMCQCFSFCQELKNLNILTVCVDEFHHDITGLCAAVYRTVVTSPCGIKTRRVAWNSLRNLAEIHRDQQQACDL